MITVIIVITRWISKICCAWYLLRTFFHRSFNVERNRVREWNNTHANTHTHRDTSNYSPQILTMAQMVHPYQLRIDAVVTNRRRIVVTYAIEQHIRFLWCFDLFIFYFISRLQTSYSDDDKDGKKIRIESVIQSVRVRAQSIHDGCRNITRYHSTRFTTAVIRWHSIRLVSNCIEATLHTKIHQL